VTAFDLAPFIVIWEATRACALACNRCGSSRARAYAATGDPFAEDPGCAYEPRAPLVASPSIAIAGSSDATVSEGAVTQALRTVFDPELGMSVVELGLVYGIEIENGEVCVTMTLTAPGCPIHDVMPEWVREAVSKLPGVERVTVTLTFDPPWSPDRIQRFQATPPPSHAW
jgi:metal-sulfur cluster biosynthetic enzyme